MGFTALSVQNLPAPAKKPKDHFETDPHYPGLAIRVAPSGRKTWTFHATFAKKRFRMDFGTFPAMTLKQARDRALDARRALDSVPPVDPRELKKAVAPPEDAEALTMKKLVEVYIADLRLVPEGERLRTIDDIERILVNHMVPMIGNVLVKDITRIQIKSVVDVIRQRGSHSMAYSVFRKMRYLLMWAVSELGLPESVNVMKSMIPPKEAKPGDNVRPLDDDEIKAFWNGIEDALPEYCRRAYSRVLKLCLLTGCRVGECAEMDMSEVTDGIWTIPENRSKNRRSHTIPLNSDMMTIIGNATSATPWGSVLGKPVTSGRVSDAFFAADIPDKFGIANDKHGKDFTIHGLRRTFATVLDELEIAESTISLCLNHATDSKERKKSSRVTRVYVKPKDDVLMARKRAAFDAFAVRLREIIS